MFVSVPPCKKYSNRLTLKEGCKFELINLFNRLRYHRNYFLLLLENLLSWYLVCMMRGDLQAKTYFLEGNKTPVV